VAKDSQGHVPEEEHTCSGMKHVQGVAPPSFAHGTSQ
jgi:hypothetical protein